MRIKLLNKSSFENPRYETAQAAGMDIKADFKEEGKGAVIAPGERRLISTGLFVELPDGIEAQVRPRSGLALKKGITVLNSPGTIDPDYRGEIGVIIINHSNDEVVVEHGDRIAQLVFTNFEHVQIDNVEELGSTDRGEGGFGSTN